MKAKTKKDVFTSITAWSALVGWAAWGVVISTSTRFGRTRYPLNQWPALTPIIWPVTGLASGEAKYTAVPAISSEWGRYLRQVSDATSSYTSWNVMSRFSAWWLKYHSTE